MKEILGNFESVRNMESNKGNKIPNQFIITTGNGSVFQSYRTIIAAKVNGKVLLDENWDYSRTTGKYRNIFLDETVNETRKKIKDGTYTVTNLN